MNIKAFENFNNEMYQRQFHWDDDHSLIDLYKNKISHIPNPEFSKIETLLNSKGLIIDKQWINIYRILNKKDDKRKGDFIIDSTFFKIDDEWFIYMDNKQILYNGPDDEEDPICTEYFKCDQIEGFLKLLESEFAGF
jgi:hypothetical protein